MAKNESTQRHDDSTFDAQDARALFAVLGLRPDDHLTDVNDAMSLAGASDEHLHSLAIAQGLRLAWCRLPPYRRNMREKEWTAFIRTALEDDGIDSSYARLAIDEEMVKLITRRALGKTLAIAAGVGVDCL